MRPLLQQVSRSLLEHATPIGPLCASKRSLKLPLERLAAPTPCVHGPLRAFSPRGTGSGILSDRAKASIVPNVRFFSSTSLRSRDNSPSQHRSANPGEAGKVIPESSGPEREYRSPPDTPSITPPPDTIDSPASDATESPTSDTTSSAPPQPTKPASPEVAAVPDDQLPSHREGQRWQLSKRFSTFMDELQSNLATASQRLNNYTGTDYSGIEALRREIKEQEQLVKARHALVNEAKGAYDAALAQQASSQKEVVGLLERKHSWLAADLERYMSLIRSEHVNDQAVQAAKDNLSSAEQALEEARTHLEKRERAQYHEEQIWSDTIRRNSTWVTFGLMGLNIFLLLASLVILEPWRRRRLVREIRGALDEKSAATLSSERAQGSSSDPANPETTVASLAPAAAAAAAATTEPSPSAQAETEAEIDAVVEPANVSLQSIEEAAAAPAEPAPAEAAPTPASPEQTLDVQADVNLGPEPERFGNWRVLLERARSYVRDLFSEHYISVRKVDLTTAALEGAAAGAAFMGILFVLLRPR